MDSIKRGALGLLFLLMTSLDSMQLELGMRKSMRGFSLIEPMIVVAIIVMLTAAAAFLFNYRKA